METGGEEGEGHLLFSVPSGAAGGFANAPASAYGLTVTPSGPVLVARSGVTSSTVGNLTTVTGTSSADVIHAQGGNQVLNLSGGDDIAITGDGDDILNGDIGADTLDGGVGEDTLEGGSGADSLIGGTGVDYASYANSTASVTVNYATGIFVGDIYSEIEGVIGTTFGDSLSGDAAQNIFSGNDGDDTLKGFDGDDQLFAGIGDDRTEGGVGNDLAQGSNGNDTMLGGDGVDTLGGGSGGDLLRGEAGADVLLGSNGDDRLFGGDDADTLQGGGGRDTLWGDGGADRIEGGDQTNTVSYDTATSKVWVRLWAGDGLAGDALGDVLVEIEDLVGSAFGDTLVGDDSVNRIDGGESGDLISGLNGDDILVGESGADTLTGGSGNEQFWFSVGGGADVVTDFSAGSAVGDVIRLFGRGPAVDTFAEAMALSSQQGANVVINFGGGDTITLQNVTLGSLAANDFMFG